MRITEGHKILCDGTYLQGGKLVPCRVELDPQTKSVINRVGTLGHHCEFCNDPARTTALAAKLGKSEVTLRKMGWEKVLEASDQIDAKASKDAADAQEALRKQQQAEEEAAAKKAQTPAPSNPAPAGAMKP